MSAQITFSDAEMEVLKHCVVVVGVDWQAQAEWSDKRKKAATSALRKLMRGLDRPGRQRMKPGDRRARP